MVVEPGAAAAALTVAAAARRLGVAPSTLRTWDRRYDLGPTGHVPGAHRRYTAPDLARLDLMRTLVRDGVPVGEAADLALHADLQRTTAGDQLGGVVARPEPPAEDGRRGGRIQELPRATESGSLAAALHRAAVALDGERVTELVRAGLARRGVVPTWNDVVVPLLVAVGNRWAATGQGIEVEHLVSYAVETALLAHTPPRTSGHGRLVLLACAQDEGHSLPLHAVSGALADRLVASQVLGARLPREALAAAVRRTAPAAVFLWSQSPATGDLGAVGDVPAVRPAPVVVVGGPGWWGDLPARTGARAQRVHDLAEAVETLVTAAR